MPNILKIKNVGDFNQHIGYHRQHPLVSVIDYAEAGLVPHTLSQYGVYALFFHTDAKSDITYGRSRYDYRAGTVICVAPGQIGGVEDNGERIQQTGWALLFHPDLLHGTSLEKNIKGYTFFEYRIGETLHMTDEEQAIYVRLMQQLKEEVEKPADEEQNRILLGYIELVLSYCQRFYKRQFMTRKVENTDALARFEQILETYYNDQLQTKLGIPTIKYCADRLFMSPNYFGDLVKKTTNDTPSSYIRQFIIRRAKNALSHGMTVAEVAYELGFEYPQHFSRMFKKQTGITPSEYVQSLRRNAGAPQSTN